MSWFGAIGDSFDRWRTMLQLRSIEKRDNQDHYWEFKNLIIDAEEFLERDHRGRAIEIWRGACARFSELAMNSDPALELALRLQLYDEAEVMLKRGHKRYPGQSRFLEGLAQLAYKRGNREEALRLCEVLRKRAPNSTKGYWIAAASLSELGKAKEAEEILVRGIQRMPEDVGLQIEYAKLAERRLDWTEALARWRVIYDTYGHRAGISGAANILTELGRYDEAESLLNGVMYKFGNEITIWVTLARVAEHRKDWEEAERRWVAIRNRFPLDSMAYLYGLRPLYTLGRVAEAEKVLLDAMERIRDDPALLTEYAWIAHRRSDWAEAAQRWAALRERFPSQRVGYEQGAVALQALGLTEEAARLGAAQTA